MLRDPATETMALAVFAALGLHALVITQLHFNWMDLSRSASAPTLDVILVDWASETPPEEADFLANAAQRGGGDNPERERPSALPEAMPETLDLLEEEAPEPVADPRESGDPGRLLAMAEPAAELAVPEAPESAVPEDVSARELMSELRRRVRQAPDPLAEVRSAPERPRRKFVTANTREHLYASYMRAWVAKVERVGNMNYPEDARRQNLEGSLVLSVDVLADGSIEHVRILRSSGFDLLDEAAVRIVRLAAPYAELPPEIREEVDVLTITRTWQFSARSGLR